MKSITNEEEQIMGSDTPYSIFHYKTKNCVVKKLNKISISSENNEVSTSNQLLIYCLSTGSNATIMSNPPLWYQDTGTASARFQKRCFPKRQSTCYGLCRRKVLHTCRSSLIGR